MGKAITQAHFLLSECLGVSNVLLDNIVKAALNAGAHGAKLGSGKEGAVFAIVDNEAVESVMRALSPSAPNVIDTVMDFRGLIVE